MRRRGWFRQEFQGGVGLTDWDTSKGIWSHMTPCANMYSEMLFRQIIIYKFSTLAHSRAKCYTTFQDVSALFKLRYFEKFHPKFFRVNFCVVASIYWFHPTVDIWSSSSFLPFSMKTSCKSQPASEKPTRARLCRNFSCGKKWWWLPITCFLARWSCVSRFLRRVDDSGKPRCCMPTGSTVDSQEPFISSGFGLDRDWI